jgi:hypothetical protein
MLINAVIGVHHLYQTEYSLAIYFVMATDYINDPNLKEEELYRDYYHWINRSIHPHFKGSVSWIGTGRVGRQATIRRNLTNIANQHQKYIENNKDNKVNCVDWWANMPDLWIKKSFQGRITYPHKIIAHEIMLNVIMRHQIQGPSWRYHKRMEENQKIKNIQANARRGRRRAEKPMAHTKNVTRNQWNSGNNDDIMDGQTEWRRKNQRGNEREEREPRQNGTERELEETNAITLLDTPQGKTVFIPYQGTRIQQKAITRENFWEDDF